MHDKNFSRSSKFTNNVTMLNDLFQPSITLAVHFLTDYCMWCLAYRTEYTFPRPTAEQEIHHGFWNAFSKRLKLSGDVLNVKFFLLRKLKSRRQAFKMRLESYLQYIYSSYRGKGTFLGFLWMFGQFEMKYQ